MKRAFTIVVCIFFHLHGWTQSTFEKKFSPSAEQYGRELFSTADHGFFLQGTIEQGWRNCYLIKTDSIGDTLWTKTYGTDSIQYFAYDMINLPDGGYLICGDYQSVLTYPSMDSYVQKIDSMGNEIWFNVFGWANAQGGGKDHAQIVNTLADGSVIVEGATKDYYFSLGNYQSLGQGWRSYLAKLDTAGNLVNIGTVTLKIDSLWGQDYMAYDVKTIGNKIYWLGANSGTLIPGNGNTVLVAFNDNLDTLFTVKTGLNAYHGISITADDHLLLFGNGIITKMDTLGNVVWNTPNISPSANYELIELSNGELASIGGTYYISPFNADFYGPFNTTVYLNRYSANGVLTGSNLITLPSGIHSQIGFTLEHTYDDGFAFAGFSENDIWLVKTDSLGQFFMSTDELNDRTYGLQLFPNPASSFCTLNSTSLITHISIYNLTGKCLKNQEVNDYRLNLDVTCFPDGVYSLEIIYRNGNKSVEKLVILGR